MENINNELQSLRDQLAAKEEVIKLLGDNCTSFIKELQQRDETIKELLQRIQKTE